MGWMDQSIETGPNQQCVLTIAAMLGDVNPPPGSCASPSTPSRTTTQGLPQEK
jgi:hypothetical protein